MDTHYITSLDECLIMIPAQFKKLLVASEHLTDKQVKDVETFLKGDNLIQPIVSELEQ